MQLHDIDLALRFIATFALVMLRYFFFAGIAYLIFYVWKRHQWFYRKIQQRFPTRKKIRQEILYSISTALIFASIGVAMRFAYQRGWGQLYTDIAQYGWGYLVLSIVLLILLHDTYFYWTHRFMHLKRVFPYVHRVHHLSHNPTPWTAFAFHPIEAVIEASIVPLAIFLIPVHPLALMLFGTWMIALNVMGHLGYELFPKDLLKHPVHKWQNTSTHHNMHHQYIKGNYGLYFNFWDRLMGTNFSHYEQTFEANASRKASQRSHLENA